MSVSNPFHGTDVFKTTSLEAIFHHATMRQSKGMTRESKGMTRESTGTKPFVEIAYWDDSTALEDVGGFNFVEMSPDSFDTAIIQR